MIAPPVSALKRQLVPRVEGAVECQARLPAGAQDFASSKSFLILRPTGESCRPGKNRQPTMLSPHPVNGHFGRKFATP